MFNPPSLRLNLKTTSRQVNFPVEYSVVQSSFLVEMSSSCGSSIPLLTSRGICGSHVNTRSSVVWETEIVRGEI